MPDGVNVTRKTVNGSFRATMGALGNDDRRYETVNGGRPLKASTVNGGISFTRTNGVTRTE